MKIFKASFIVIVLVLVVLLVAAPIGPVPGVFIGGNSAEIPADWGNTQDVHEIKLGVGGGLIPRVVIIWVIQHDNTLYVVGSKDSGWVTRIGQGTPVDMRLHDNTYAMRATPVTEGWEAVLAAYIAKYQADYPDIIEGFPSIEEARGSVAVFKLSAQ